MKNMDVCNLFVLAWRPPLCRLRLYKCKAGACPACHCVTADMYGFSVEIGKRKTGKAFYGREFFTLWRKRHAFIWRNTAFCSARAGLL